MWLAQSSTEPGTIHAFTNQPHAEAWAAQNLKAIGEAATGLVKSAPIYVVWEVNFEGETQQ